MKLQQMKNIYTDETSPQESHHRNQTFITFTRPNIIMPGSLHYTLPNISKTLSFSLSTANFLSSAAYPSFFTAPLRFLRDGGDGNSIQQKGKAKEFEKSGYCVKCLQLQDIVLNACSCRNVLTNNNYHSILTSLAFLTALKKLTPFNAMFPPIWKPSHLKL